MKIILTAPPFSGHLHPIIAIAKRLAEDKDLEVMIVSTLAAKNRIEKENIIFKEILNGYDNKIEQIANPETKIKSNPIKLFKQLKENVSILNQLKKEFEVIVKETKPDLIISDFTLPVIGIVAKENGVKWHTTLPSPCVYESDGVPAYLGGLYPPKNNIEQFKYNLLNQLIKTFKKTAYFIFKKELKSINLNAIYDKEGNENIYSNERVYALGMSELEFNQPYQKQFKYIGPILYSPVPEYNNPMSFEKQKTYVLVTMGTHLKFMKKELIESVKILAQSYKNLEFHITMGEDKEIINETLENVKVLNYISYDKYLNNYTYVIHHGGTGITYECIKRGIVSMVFPQDYDQFDNAARLDYFGLSIRNDNFNNFSENFEKLLNNKKLINQNKIYQNLFNNYLATEEIYQEIKNIAK